MTVDELKQSYELILGAICLYREARSEGREGLIAVWSVIKNRLADPRWPDTISGVVLQPWQFSSFNMSDPQSSWMPRPYLALGAPNQHWEDCLQVIAENPPDNTNGATHYHADYVAPAWASKYEKTATIGRHIFYYAPPGL